MSWYQSISFTEIVFIAVFILFYVVYLVRVFMISRFLQVRVPAIIGKLFWRSLYFALFIVALLGPSFGESSKEIQSVGKDIMIAIDLSQSMDANDVQPTRLEKVKFELKNVANAFSADRIGLIIFSSEAFIQSPLTYDQSALSLFIETLNTNLVPKTGTDFGPPLEMALSKLRNENSGVNQTSKVIILISDGEDFGDETDDVASQIENEGIRLFTIGVGSENGSTISTPNGLKRDKNGEIVVSKLNSSALQRLAVNTGGKYFEINETNNDISRLINTINSIEGELRDVKRVDVTANKYYYFLAAALVLLVLDLLIGFKTVKSY